MIYKFEGPNGSTTKCDLQFFSGPFNQRIVVATEFDDNDGSSITNVAEHLAMAVCRDYNINPAALVWIEHYPDRKMDAADDSGAESWDWVVFQVNEGRLSNPEWRPLEDKAHERLKEGWLPDFAPETNSPSATSGAGAKIIQFEPDVTVSLPEFCIDLTLLINREQWLNWNSENPDYPEPKQYPCLACIHNDTKELPHVHYLDIEKATVLFGRLEAAVMALRGYSRQQQV